MSQLFIFDVFLSHSSKDKTVVRAIAERLKVDGVRVWFDEWMLKPGDNIPSKIEAGLEHSRVLVLFMSSNAFDSDWAQLETGTFRFRDPLNKDRRFIPLRLDDSPIKGSLAQFLYINWSTDTAGREQEYSKLLDACRPEKTPPFSEQQQTQENQLKIFFTCGHTDSIRNVSWSPDGLRALSGASDKSLRIWDVESGGCLAVMLGHTERINSVAWSSDGLMALSGADDNTLRLWDVESGRCKNVFEGHDGKVNSVALSPDGLRALSGAWDNTVRLWNVESGRCIAVYEGHIGTVNSVVWSPDGLRALSGAWDKTVRIWDVESGRCISVLKGHTGSISNVAWSPDGHWILSGGWDDTIKLWDVESGRCIKSLEEDTGSVNCVAWSPDCLRALTGAWNNIRLRNLQSGQFIRVLDGHAANIISMAWSPDRFRVITGANDKTVRIWDVETGRCLASLDNAGADTMRVSPDGKRVLFGSGWGGNLLVWDLELGRFIRKLEGHAEAVNSVAWSQDGRLAISGANDATVRLWDIESGQFIREFRDHTGAVKSVAWNPNELRILSGGCDHTVRLWDVESGQCIRVLEGHTGTVKSVAWSPDGLNFITGANDATVRLWETETGRCIHVLEGHTGAVNSVAWSPEGRHALSGAEDKTVRLWNTESGRCIRVLDNCDGKVISVAWSHDGRRAFSGAHNGAMMVWAMELSDSGVAAQTQSQSDIIAVAPDDQVQYTNAKVLLVGETHSGKTGLTHRLATGNWKPSEDSTVGAWSTQWQLHGVSAEQGVDREIWLWDFGGQADQRLIHQLYMDRTDLILLLFNADQDDVLPGLRDWLTALRRCVKEKIPNFLVAGRVDTGFKASRGKLQAFAREQGLAYHETSAKEGTGCDRLRADMIASISWDQMEKRTSPRIFKLIKDEILKLRDEGKVLHTFKELREILWQRLSGEPRFRDENLKTVVGLLDGPGIVKELDYGTYILLAPEWINAYAQAVIRTLRSEGNDLGVLPQRSIAEGKLIYQSIGRDGIFLEMKRLPPFEERIVLGEMERQLEQRGLCLRQGDKLVFPSHCGRDRPAVMEHPSVFVSYAVKGFLDDIYATLVVRLADSESFQIKELWRDAADFATLAGDHHMGIKLTRETASNGDISVYFGKGVTQEEQVIFANYIHAHLHRTCEQAQRLRHYVCPHCHSPKGNPELLMKKLLIQKEEADTECDGCGNRFPLWDALEKIFASEEVRKQVNVIQGDDIIKIDSRRKGKLLVLDVGARITSANQKWHEIPQEEDDGIDIILEFTDEHGNGIGKGLCLQLKAGNSHLKKRKTDSIEIFAIKKQRWVKTWMNQPYPVMLVIGTFSEEDDQTIGKEKVEFVDVRWMEISSVLKRKSQNGKKAVKQIEFKAERMDMSSVRKWRDKYLAPKESTIIPTHTYAAIRKIG